MEKSADICLPLFLIFLSAILISMSEIKTTKLFETLRQWRNDMAIKEGKKPYMVFNNETLKLTALALPQTKDDLQSIKGWGEKKIKRYGDEILVLVNNPDAMPTQSSDQTLSVQQFLELVNKTLFQHVSAVKVRGEITEVSKRERYAFFQLKDSSNDNDYLVECFVSWRNYDELNHLLEDGFEVVVLGFSKVYKTGRFRLEVEKIDPVGEGALKKAFELLKKKLAAKGYFDLKRKRPVPEIVQSIGLITSEASAAINDFRKNLGNYGFHLYLRDVLVEGDRAEESIISAIEWINKHRPDLDVLVLMRGGGSLESLKAFNSEGVADAMITSRLPIITGIGHEKDITIADFIADKSFSTPTAVSVFIRTQREELIASIESYYNELIDIMNEKFRYKKEHLKYMYERLSGGVQHVFNAYRLLEQAFLRSLYQYSTTIDTWTHRLHMAEQYGLNGFERQLRLGQEKINALHSVLTTLNPEAILKRGYSITYDSDKNTIKDVKQVKHYQKLLTKLYRGEIISRVEKTK
ncbi:exodeoxyribonuclease VII large subunit [Patescibacteria group bacterium AH-259-L05]|nr:exodeoxyribonuclease VII large subunit [Patescibacteria group bacterium AH-259-L05]